MTKRFKIAIAPDSFKGSLTAMEAADCIEEGFKRALSGIAIRKIPIADGGDGTVRAIVDATGGRLVKRTVHDPLGRKIKAEFGLSGDGKTAVIEMAAASGLVLLRPPERNPLKTSTRGTGELIRAALKLGAQKILVGIGGSATSDGGTGMARALGIRFFDKRGKELPEGGGALTRLAGIDTKGLDPRIRKASIDVACDVDNPLTGPHGAARVYGPQKGATPEMVERLEEGLVRMDAVIESDLGMRINRVPGAGAAGGLGAGLMAFLGGKLRPGIEIVIDTVKLHRRLKGCDLVVTGEGRIDGQTAFGKAPAGVAGVAKSLGIPVIAISGCAGPDAAKVLTVGIDAVFPALEEPVDEEDLPDRAPAMLSNCAEQVGRLLALNLHKRAPLKPKKK